MKTFVPALEVCPYCGSKGNCVPFAYYDRHLVDFIHGQICDTHIRVLRVQCSSCQHTHAILPDVIFPYASYSLFFILRVLDEYFMHRLTVSNAQLSLICGAIGTVLLHTKIRDGASKDKIERNFRTLKERWLYGLDLSQITFLHSFNELLLDYIRQHNLTVHSATKETPFSRYQNTKAHISIAPSKDWLSDCFFNRITRKVNKDATLSMDGLLNDIKMLKYYRRKCTKCHSWLLSRQSSYH